MVQQSFRLSLGLSLLALAAVAAASQAGAQTYPSGMIRLVVPGPAADDLANLLAELVDNATAFSAPETRVRVSGQKVGSGYVLEVEPDRLEDLGATVAHRGRDPHFRGDLE